MNAILVDIGGTYIRVGTLDKSCDSPIISVRTPSELNAFLKCLLSQIEIVAIEHNIDLFNGVIAISCPGVIENNVIKKSIYTCLTGVDLVKIINKRFGCTVYIMNDAAVQALGLYKDKSLLFMCIGTGVGGAYIREGNLYACELGHIFSQNTYLCKCGKTGCLDAIASGKHFVERFGDCWWERAKNNDIKLSIENAGKAVGFVLSQAVMFCDPEEIWINGHICLFDIFKERVVLEFDKNVWNKRIIKFDVSTWVIVYKGLKKILISRGV